MFCYAVNEKKSRQEIQFFLFVCSNSKSFIFVLFCFFLLLLQHCMYLKKADFDLTVVFDLNDQDEDICHVKVFRLNGLSSLFSILRTSAYNLLGSRTNYKHVCDTSSVYFFLKAIFASPI